MQSGGKKVIKTEKTKFRRTTEDNENKKLSNKPKHHDRSYYRLLKQEKEDYVL